MRCVKIANCVRAARLDNLFERRFKTDLDQSYEPSVSSYAGAGYSGRLIADMWDTSRLHTGFERDVLFAEQESFARTMPTTRRSPDTCSGKECRDMMTQMLFRFGNTPVVPAVGTAVSIPLSQSSRQYARTGAAARIEISARYN